MVNKKELYKQAELYYIDKDSYLPSMKDILIPCMFIGVFVSGLISIMLRFIEIV